MMKKCSQCKIEKELEDFYKWYKSKDGKTSECKDCIHSRQKKYYIENKDKITKRIYAYRKIHADKYKRYFQNYEKVNKEQISINKWRRAIKKDFGITEEIYNKFLETQKNACAICGAKESGKKGNRWQIDHDHKNGIVRGLLCKSCNMKLGWFEKLQSNILKYLKIAAPNVL